MKTFIGTVLLAAITAAPVAANADTITYDFTVTGSTPPVFGPPPPTTPVSGLTIDGTFSVDPSIAPSASDPFPDVLTGLDFTWNGSTFTPGNAVGYFNAYQNIYLIGDNCSIGACIVNKDDANDWDIYLEPTGRESPSYSGGFNYSYGAPTAGAIYYGDATASPVPLPATAWLLLSALGGLGSPGVDDSQPEFCSFTWLGLLDDLTEFAVSEPRAGGYPNYSLKDAAQVMSEIMKTLMEAPGFDYGSKSSMYLTYQAVQTPPAKEAWEHGSCENIATYAFDAKPPDATIVLDFTSGAP